MNDNPFMSDDGSPALLADPSPAAKTADAPAASFDPDANPFANEDGSPAFLEAQKTPEVDLNAPPSRAGALVSAVTDIPKEIGSAAGAATADIAPNLNPVSGERRVAIEKEAANPSFLGGMGDQISRTLGVGKGLAAIPALVASPVVGAARSVIGHGLQAVSPDLVPYDVGKQEADKILAAWPLNAAGRTRLPGYVAPVKPLPVVADFGIKTGEFGVPLTAGQASGELPLIQTEQSALANRMGPRAQKLAQIFMDKQNEAVRAAHEGVASTLDPIGTLVADTPKEAGDVVGQALGEAKTAAKAKVDAAYTEARSLPGEIHTEAFSGIGEKLKRDLSEGDQPVIIDPTTTPNAAKAIQDITNNVGKLKIPNLAEPQTVEGIENAKLAPEDKWQKTGVNLAGVDQWRKRLSTFRNDAFGTNNAADQRATKAVLDAFDNHVDNAVNSGMFSGDPRAVQAWNDARAANADYRSTFSAGKNDPVGRVVQKIVGDRTNDPAIGNDVADFLYGGTGVNPNSVNVGVAKRVAKIVGEDSPAWSATRQGLFSRLTETPQGVTDWGPGKVAQKLNQFLNGDGAEMAKTVYTPAQREMIQSYADLQRQLEVPALARNPSNTSTFVTHAIQKITDHIGVAAGFLLGHHFGEGMMGEAIGAGLGKGADVAASSMIDAIRARKIAKQMPDIQNAMDMWRKAADKAAGIQDPMTNKQFAFATANLSRQLQPIGISLKDVLSNLQLPATSRADQNQANVPGAPAQQDNQDQSATPQRAAGGRVDQPDHNPSEAQKAAGNYRKQHVSVQGLPITIENAKHSFRSGVGADGRPWRCRMRADYGYIKRTEGADGDHVDCYVGPNAKSDKVFIVDQRDHKTKKFDEHKCLIGFNNKGEALGVYKGCFSDGRGHERIGGVTEMTMADFKDWLKHEDTTKAVAA